MKNWLKNFGLAILLMFLVLFILAWLAYTIILLKNDPGLANAYVAIGTLILATVTALLAGFTYLNIKSGEARERRDRKERLLNEIIEWAVDVSKCGIEKGYPDISNLIDLQAVWLKISNNVGDIILCFKEMRGKNQYITEIVKALDQDLKEAAKILTDDFEEHINLLSLCETYMKDSEKAWKNAVKHKHKLNASAKKVIEEASKIKTKDID